MFKMRASISQRLHGAARRFTVFAEKGFAEKYCSVGAALTKKILNMKKRSLQGVAASAPGTLL